MQIERAVVSRVFCFFIAVPFQFEFLNPMGLTQRELADAIRLCLLLRDSKAHEILK